MLTAEEFGATQHDAVDKLVPFMRVNPTDRLHIETVSGFWATYTMFTKDVGIPESHVVAHHPKGLDKPTRLKVVSHMLEAAHEDKGLAPPVCEFPGVLDEKGNLIPDPALNWFFREILNAGQTKKTACLDALTQVLSHLEPTYGVRSGEITTMLEVQQQAPSLGSARPFFLPNKVYQSPDERRSRQPAQVQELVFLQ